jgi:protein phosphatase
MHLISAGRSDIGRKREANEDFLAAVDGLGLYLVADGLGGHVAGRIASETGASTFIEHLYLTPGEVPAQGLRRACRGANQVIRERADADDRLWGMGTTLVSLWIRDRYATLAHVGDSRAYLLREQKLARLTYDHSLVGELVLRRVLTSGQARSHSNRHVITRALGVRSSVEPDLVELRVCAGDVFVLCTDGITAQLEDEEVRDTIRDARGQLQRASETLIAMANDRGGEDNATVLLVGCDL